MGTWYRIWYKCFIVRHENASTLDKYDPDNDTINSSAMSPGTYVFSPVNTVNCQIYARMTRCLQQWKVLYGL